MFKIRVPFGGVLLTHYHARAHITLDFELLTTYTALPGASSDRGREGRGRGVLKEEDIVLPRLWEFGIMRALAPDVSLHYSYLT